MSDPQKPTRAPQIAAILPCYRVTAQILPLLERIGAEVSLIYVVDDACPDRSGDLVETECKDARGRVLRHAENQGVGAATMTGYRQALADGAEILVKLDGDGQMDPALIPRLVHPVASGEADYSKGNRFYRLEGLASMPRIRLFGNSILSFLTKFSTGYWQIFDPTNGFTALHARVAEELPFEKVSARYFFESDLLFRLGTIGAVVEDVPMDATYLDEESQLRVHRVGPEFLRKHAVNLGKRIFYNYYLRNFNIASLELVLGLALVTFGTIVGVHQWTVGAIENRFASAGTVMLAALPIIVGSQLLIGFLNHDMQNVPRKPVQRRLRGAGRDGA